VIDRGVAYRSGADGVTAGLAPDATSPYATVIPFAAEERFALDGALHREAFEAELGRRLPLANRIWALRIEGRFEHVTAGASERQRPPFRPLAAVMPAYRTITGRDVTGTLVAFHCPVVLTGVDYVGGHYPWLPDDRAGGGHVFGFATREVTVEACEPGPTRSGCPPRTASGG
jgi:acetolactate decarboxylase